jgi:pyridoxal phosphate enzyme (YggS family)
VEYQHLCGGASSVNPQAMSGLDDVLARIAAAAERVGREASSVSLVAVSKAFGAEAIAPVIAAGQRRFGENRVQESQGKWPALKSLHPDLELHLVGPLQTNKVADAVALFDVIETIDREKLARAVAKEVERQQRRPRLFIQVNTGEEPQKSGVSVANADGLVALCRTELGLAIEGLMCVPPIEDEPALHFALLRKIAERNGLQALSMGMSSDFETAIAFGATHVRVGSAIFGSRGRTG